MLTQDNEITQLLRRWQVGDRDAESRIFELLLPQLHLIAARCFRGENSGHSLQPTALVNEAFLKLAAARNIDWQDRGHFLAMAARFMRRYLIDHARARPDVVLLPMDGLPERILGQHSKLELAVAVDALLDELAKDFPQRRAAVELKFFLRLTDIEAAEALNLTLHTFQREWHRARKWLFDRLSSKSCQELQKTTNV